MKKAGRNIVIPS